MYHSELKSLLTGLLSLSLGLSLSLPLMAQPATASVAQLRQTHARQPNNPAAAHALADALLVELRRDWGLRDLNASGAAFQAQADELQLRARELVQLYEQVLKQDPRRLDAQVHLAEVYFVFLNQFQQAENLLLAALKQEAHHPKATIALAEYQFFFKGQVPEALQRLEQALQQHPHHPGLVISWVDLRTRSSAEAADYVSARERVAAALAQQAGDENLRHMLGNLWLREADLTPQLDRAKAQNGLQLYTELFESNRDPDQALEVAQIARDMGEIEQARAMIEAGLQVAPEHARLQLLKGDIWLKAGAEALEARRFSAELQAAQAAYQQIVARQKAAELLLGEQVQLYYNLGLLALLQAQQADITDPDALLARAVGFFREAQTRFDRLNMVNAPLQQELARALELQGERLLLKKQEGPAREAFGEACELGLESSCARLRR